MKADHHELLLNLAAHPLLWGIARLGRRIGPIWRVPGLGIIVNDAECAREILQRDDDFVKNGPDSFAQAFTAGLGPIALTNMDGEEHRRLRASIADVLAPARTDQLVANRSVELELMGERLTHGETVDLAYFIRGWSGRIAFDVLGVTPPPGREEEASHDIVQLGGHMASVLGFRRLSKRQERIAFADAEQLTAYFRTSYEQSAPPSSLIDRLQTLGYTFEQAKGLMVIFVIASTLSISAALPRIVALLIDSEQFVHLAKDPECIPQAIDEGLRFVAPLPGTVRLVQRDSVVRGHKLTAGSRLILLTSNMARDPKLYPDPDRFDVTRSHNRQAGRLWYGAGPHRCAGFNLAQRELKSILGTMASVKGEFRIVHRRAAVGALIPAYARLIVQSSNRSN